MDDVRGDFLWPPQGVGFLQTSFGIWVYAKKKDSLIIISEVKRNFKHSVLLLLLIW